MNKFDWFHVPALQLIKSRDEPTLNIANEANTVTLYNLDKQPVISLALSKVKAWQTVQDLISDVGDAAVENSIPLYLPTITSDILDYVNTDTYTNIDRGLEWLRIANYLQDMQRLNSIAQQLGTDLIQQFLGADNQLEGWYYFFLNDYPHELSQLIISDLVYNTVDIFTLMSNQLEIEFNLRYRLMLVQLSRSFLTKYDPSLFKVFITRDYQKYKSVYIADLAKNQNWTNQLILEHFPGNLFVHYQFIKYATDQSEVSWPLISDQWLQFLEHILELSGGAHRMFWSDLLMSVKADPIWILNHVDDINHTLTGQSDFNRPFQLEEIYDFLSHSHLLTEQLIRDNLGQGWSWITLSMNPAMSDQFIQATYGLPNYHWNLDNLRFHAGLDGPWLLGKLVTQPQFDPYNIVDYLEYSENINWTWAKFQPFVPPLLDQNINITEQLVKRRWIHENDFADIYQAFKFEAQGFSYSWFLGRFMFDMAHNPNLSETFILEHLKLLIYQSGDKLILAKGLTTNQAFTLDIWRRIVEIYGQQAYRILQIEELTRNPNFGVGWLLANWSLYTTNNEDKVKIQAAAPADIWQLIEMMQNYHKLKF